MSNETRGYASTIRRLTVDTAGLEVRPFATTTYLQISNSGANELRYYTEQTWFDEDAGLAGTDGFIVLAASTGFFEGPAEFGKSTGREHYFLRAGAGSTEVEVIEYYRRS